MIRSILLAMIAMISLCQSANAQMIQLDGYFDFKIEVRNQASYGRVVFYDSHEPVHHYSQVNRQWRAFTSNEQADEFFAARPNAEILEEHSSMVGKSDWMEVDLVATFAQAESRIADLRRTNRYRIDARLIPVLQKVEIVKTSVSPKDLSPQIKR